MTASGTEGDWQDTDTFPTKDSITGPQGLEVQKTDHNIRSHSWAPAHRDAAP